MNRHVTSRGALLVLLAASFLVPPQALADPNDGAPAANGGNHGTVRWLKTPAALRRELNREAHEAAARPSPLRRVGNVAGAGARMVGDPVFIGAIALSDLANAGWNGDIDKARDLGHSLTTPEFYAGVGLFNATYRGTDALLNRAGSTRLGTAVASRTPPALAAGGKLLKHNLVLAAAMTLPRIVEFDFGGFTAKDAAKADFSKLKNAHVGINPKVDGQDLAITLGSFAVAQPTWGLIKKAAGMAGKRLLKRLAVTAGIKLASQAVPVGGQAFTVALTVGEIAWFAVDLAGLLLTAHAIEKPIKEWNDQRRFQNDTKDAIEKLLEVSRKNGGKPDEKELNEALANVALSFRNLRDLHYLPAAFEDATLVNRLSRWGVTKEKLTELSTKVMDEYGMDLSPLAQTVILKREYDAVLAAGKGLPNHDKKDFEGSYTAYRERVKKEIGGIYGAVKLAPERLDPTAKDFALSVNRAQLYEQEMAVYARVREILQAEELRTRIGDEVAVVGALAEVDAALVKEALGETPAPDVDPGPLDASLPVEPSADEGLAPPPVANGLTPGANLPADAYAPAPETAAAPAPETKKGPPIIVSLSKGRKHLVKTKDTLSAIAAKNGMTVDALLAYDGGTGTSNKDRLAASQPATKKGGFDPNLIYPGQVLLVPAKDAGPKSPGLTGALEKSTK